MFDSPDCKHGVSTYAECTRCIEEMNVAERSVGRVPEKALEKKLSNPKDSVGVRKARWFSYIPSRVLVYVGLAMLEGARKYGRHNYRVAGVRASVYLDATICGHLTPFWEGEDIDPKSGVHHVIKAIASLIVLADGIMEGNWEDDRPPKIKSIDTFFEEADKVAIDIIDNKVPNAVEAFTELNKKAIRHG